MSAFRYIYLDCDFDVYAQELYKPSTGDYLDAATVTWTLYQSDKTTVVSTGSLSYTTGSNGDYLGVIPATVTTGLTVGSTYYVKVVAAESGADGVWWGRCVAALQGTV